MTSRSVVGARSAIPCISLGVLLAAASAAQSTEQRLAKLRALASVEATSANCQAAALALGDEELQIRMAAIDVLITLRPNLKRQRMVLRKLVQEAATARRRQWIWQGQQGVAGLVPAREVPKEVLVALESSDADARRQAVVDICRCGTGAAAHVDKLLSRLTDADGDVRAAVAKNILAVAWSVKIRDAVLGALHDPEAHVRGGAAEGLASKAADAKIVDGLRTLIQDPDVGVRAKALRGLGRSGKFGEIAENEILVSVRDREAKVRVAALEALRRRGMKGERAVKMAAACVGDRDRKVRLAALRAVQAHGEAAAAALSDVLAITRSGRNDERRLAIGTAWSIAPAGGDGAVVLRTVELLNDTIKVRKAALAALGAWVEGDRQDGQAERVLRGRVLPRAGGR